MILTVAILLSVLPSLVLKVKLSEPEKLVLGWYCRLGGVPDSWPLAGFDTNR